jgi:uncharacterized protein YlxW (UPF0749 family)
VSDTEGPDAGRKAPGGGAAAEADEDTASTSPVPHEVPAETPPPHEVETVSGAPDAAADQDAAGSALPATGNHPDQPPAAVPDAPPGKDASPGKAVPPVTKKAASAGEPRLLAGFWGASPAGLLIGLLLALLGFGLVVQLQSNTGSGLLSRRQDDLVRILDDLSSREDRLRQQITALQATRDRLSAGGDSSAAALEEGRRRAAELGILAGTMPAEGPGIEMTISDAHHKVTAEDMLDAIEELRGAGAEAISVGRVRIAASSAFTQDTSSSPILVDGNALVQPYFILAIGDPATLATAMNIPGGVVDTVRSREGDTTIRQRNRLVISALREVRTPQYAQPSPTPNN